MKMQPESALQEIVAFLAEPNSYSHRPDFVTIVETHASVVAIAGPFVFKVKKPVNFGFLNYSTLDRRRQFCEREIELNRRLCPDVYLGVRPIIRRDERLEFGAFDDARSAVDYAVQMHRLTESQFLSTMIDRGQVTERDLHRVASTLVPFYRQQPPLTLCAANSLQQIRETMLGNLHICAKYAYAPPRSQYKALGDFIERFLASRSDLLRQRIESGCVKECHGDLRPEHIHIAPDRVRIYDCIEFNDALRCIDPSSDIAFLSMELAFADRWDLSKLFLEHVIGELGDGDMPRLMDFYHSYRAAVRAKVAFLRADDTQIGSRQKEQCASQARRYLQLALRFALFGSAPTTLAVMGPVATGKSTLASALGEILGWSVISSDRVRKELAGLPLYQRPDAQLRQQLYAEPMTRKTYRRLIELAVREVECRHGVIVDATFGRHSYRDQLSSALAGRGHEFCFVELRASDELIRDRLEQRAKGAGSISDALLEDAEQLRGSYEAPEELHPGRIIRIDSAASATETLDQALTHLVTASLAVR